MTGQPDQGPTYIQQLTAEINSIDACAELQMLANEAMATIQGEINQIEDELASLVPIKVLLTIPGASLSAIVNWIGNFINGVLVPIYAPFLKYEMQLLQTVRDIAALTQALEAAASRITHCSLSIQAPVITVPLPSLTVQTTS